MTELKVYDGSSIDTNLEIYWPTNEYEFWLPYVRSLDGVIDAVWGIDYMGGYTSIIFENDTYKNLFILRWS